jgi:hypothetical protein
MIPVLPGDFLRDEGARTFNRRSSKEGFKPGELLVAAVVAGGLDERARLGEVLAGGGGVAFGEVEAGVSEVGVGFVEAEAAAGGEGEGFVEVAAGGGERAGVGVEVGAGEEAAGEVVLMASTTQELDGLLKVIGDRGEVGGGVALRGEEVGSAKGEVVEDDVEERIAWDAPFEELLGTFLHFGIPALIEQEVAVLKAPKRVESRRRRLALLLHPLGLLELRSSVCTAAHRVQGRGQRRPPDHALESIAALVGQLDALPGHR